MHGMSVSDGNLFINSPIVSEAAPIVIGGIGGSGTRVVTQLLQSLGFDMGSDLNESLDDLGFTALFKRPSLWPPESHQIQLEQALRVYLNARAQPYAKKSTSNTEPDFGTTLNAIRREDSWIEAGKLEDRLTALCSSQTATSPLWGWKEPNTHLFLPFLLAAMPKLKYVHVVRHGLDMAHSRNQTQLNVWGKQLLNRAISAHSPDDSLAFWCATQERMMGIQAQMPSRVLILRFESLFEEPQSTLASLGKFLNLDLGAQQVEYFLLNLQKPTSFGRYKTHTKLEMTASIHGLLTQLSYSVD
jgi:hypothetical protein